MKVLAALFVLGYATQVVLAAPAPSISPAMQSLLMDMIQKMLAQGPNPMKLKPHLPPSPMKPPVPQPIPQYMPPARQPPPQPMPPPSGNNNVFMDMPSGGAGGYAMSMNSVYCPPGPTSSDSCKDQKLIEALYFPDTTPRYNWVPPFPYDGSVPDSVKDTAQNILMMKVNSRPNRMIYPKEQELLSILGDINHMG